MIVMKIRKLASLFPLNVKFKLIKDVQDKLFCIL
jgi:hypothetical protein